MKGVLIRKVVVIGLLVMGLMVPLSIVSSLVRERGGRRATVVEEIKASTSQAQRVAGPILVIPYKVRSMTTVSEDAWLTCGAEQHEQPAVVARARVACVKAKKMAGETIAVSIDVQKETYADLTLTLAPDVLRIAGDVAVKALHRGIYEALTYNSNLTLTGGFTVDLGELARNDNVTFGQPWLALGVADVRGLRASPQLRWQGKTVAVSAGNQLAMLGNGVHAALPPLKFKERATYEFAVTLGLLGTESLRFSPVGRDTTVQLAADWPHPSFNGGMLPAVRDVRSDGFDARWQTSWFATNMDRAVHDQNASAFGAQDFGVTLLQPINPYQQTLRAGDYGVLFVLLMFVAFFLFEIVAQLRIHPLQYGLVGAALATFYLLLIALSEHLPFATAYAISAGACALLCTFYLSYVLRHWRRGVAFGGLLGALYGALFGVLQSEDHALLLGATLVFVALTAVMVLTRRMDWYAVGSRVAVAE